VAVGGEAQGGAEPQCNWLIDALLPEQRTHPDRTHPDIEGAVLDGGFVDIFSERGVVAVFRIVTVGIRPGVVSTSPVRPAK
jgi:hypothetical protein